MNKFPFLQKLKPIKYKLHVLFVFQDGETPLVKATKMRSIDVVELLLDKGAKVSAVDRVRLCKP